MNANATNCLAYIENLQRALEILPGKLSLTITPSKVILGRENYIGGVAPVLCGSVAVAEKLAREITQAYNQESCWHV